MPKNVKPIPVSAITASPPQIINTISNTPVELIKTLLYVGILRIQQYWSIDVDQRKREPGLGSGDTEYGRQEAGCRDKRGKGDDYMVIESNKKGQHCRPFNRNRIRS